MEQRKYYVYGEMRIPICILSGGLNKQDALNKIAQKFNRRSVVLDGDLNLKNGSSHPLIADEVNIEWFEATDKDDN